MDKKLENLIRQWLDDRAGQAVPSETPSEGCLDFQQAEAMVRGEVDPQASSHVDQCPRCQQLVDDFREALEESEPVTLGAKAQVRRYRWAIAAMAASLLAMASVGIWLLSSLSRPDGQPPALAMVTVGLSSQIESGITPKGPLRFSSGDLIMFQIELHRPQNVYLINLDATGTLTLVPPFPDEPNRHKAPTGHNNLGPFRLDANVGREFFFVVSASGEIPDLEKKVEALQALYNRGKDPAAVAREIAHWRVDVRTVSFSHVP